MRLVTPANADLLILGPNRVGIAAIDVVNPMNFSLEAAKDYRRVYYPPDQSFHLPYYLIASQEMGYLWLGSSGGDRDADPAAVFSLAGVVGHYTPEVEEGYRFRGSDLELFFYQWLFGIAMRFPEAREALGDFSDSPLVAQFIDDIEGEWVFMREHR